jgi:hypothetical protein
MSRTRWRWHSFTVEDTELEQKLAWLQGDDWEVMAVYQSHARAAMSNMIIVARRCIGSW